MTLTQIHTLLAVLDYGGFTEASKRLFMTQSAVSQAIATLEQELGIEILIRERRKALQLTDAGSRIASHLRAITREVNAVKEIAEQEKHNPTRTLRIGCFASIARARLPELLRAFRELHPEIKMDVLVRGDELPAALASGEIQLALVDEARAQGFDFLPLADTPLVAVVPPDFPWEGETIPLERLLREPFLSSPDQYIEPFLPPDTPRLEVTASDDGSILSMVAGGLGVSVLSSFSLVGYEGQVRVLQLEKPIALRLGAAVKSVNTIGTSARMFLTFLREYYGKDDTQ